MSSPRPQKPSIVLGLSGRQLRDLDLLSKSDPYVVISRQAQPGGPWVAVRTSETIDNNLNPEWKDFLIYDSELGSGSQDDILLEVFDDDGKRGKDRGDQIIGFVKTRVSKLIPGSTFTIKNKSGRETGRVLVRSFRRNNPSPPAPAGYPAPAPSAPASYPPAPASYPVPPAQMAPGYSATGGFSSPGYSAPAPGYTPSAPGYPAAAPGYPAAAPGYPTTAPGYPTTAPGYPTTAPGYPAPALGYPGAPAQAPYPTPTPGYPSAPGAGYPGAPQAPATGYPDPGAGYPGAPAGQALYPGLPPAASAALPYPAQPNSPSQVQGMKPHGPQGLMAQMQGMVRPQGGAGGFRLP